MDQFISCLGKAGHALLLDCRSLDFKLLPIPDGVRLVVSNTMVKHEHASGEYNRRREECEQGVKILSQWYPEIRALRDLSVDQLERHAKDLPPTIYRRCAHVVTENQRVLDGATCLSHGDLHGLDVYKRQVQRHDRSLDSLRHPGGDLVPGRKQCRTRAGPAVCASFSDHDSCCLLYTSRCV